jgi:hypothetical protein
MRDVSERYYPAFKFPAYSDTRLSDAQPPDHIRALLVLVSESGRSPISMV